MNEDRLRERRREHQRVLSASGIKKFKRKGKKKIAKTLEKLNKYE